MTKNLCGKTAIVTGGTKGIGRSIAYDLAWRGAFVYVLGRHPEAIAHIHNAGKIKWVCADLCELNPRYINGIKDEVKQVDILVNNVGGGGRWGDIVPHITHMNVWLEVMKKNYGIAAFMFVHFATFLMAAAEESYGRVITISSMYGKESGGRPWFDAAKAAQIAMMKSLSRSKYAEMGITFNTVAPGYVHVAGKDDSDVDIENIPMKRMATPQEIASVVSFLCSADSSYVNGACITVDGGYSHAY